MKFYEGAISYETALSMSLWELRSMLINADKINKAIKDD